MPVVDVTFLFKDEIVRHKRNKTKVDGRNDVVSMRQKNCIVDLVKKLRRAEKKMITDDYGNL